MGSKMRVRNVPITLSFPPEVNAVLRGLAVTKGTTMSSVIRQALGIMQTMEAETRAGLYVGSTPDREALKTVIVAPL